MTNHLRALASLSLLVFAGGCISEPERVNPGGRSLGEFSITVQEFQTGPTNGTSSFQLETVETVSTLTLTLVDSLGFSAIFTGPGAPIVGDAREMGEEAGLVNALITRRTQAGVVERYVVTAGTLVLRGVSATRVTGTVDFTARQTEGPSVGSIIHGSGTFSAVGGNSER